MPGHHWWETVEKSDTADQDDKYTKLKYITMKGKIATENKDIILRQRHVVLLTNDATEK